MPYQPAVGDAYLFGSNPDRPKHLHVLLKRDGNLWLCANFSTVRGLNSDDLTCVIGDGEHEFIKVESYVSYPHADIIVEPRLIRMIGKKGFILKAPVSIELVGRVIDGMTESPYTRPFVLNHLQN